VLVEVLGKRNNGARKNKKETLFFKRDKERGFTIRCIYKKE
jgi:hypothetical protein